MKGNGKNIFVKVAIALHVVFGILYLSTAFAKNIAQAQRYAIAGKPGVNHDLEVSADTADSSSSLAEAPANKISPPTFSKPSFYEDISKINSFSNLVLNKPVLDGQTPLDQPKEEEKIVEPELPKIEQIIPVDQNAIIIDSQSLEDQQNDKSVLAKSIFNNISMDSLLEKNTSNILVTEINEEQKVAETPEAKLEEKPKKPLFADFDFENALTKPKVEIQPRVTQRVITVASGDTFNILFQNIGYGINEIAKISQLLKNSGFNPASLKVGQKFILAEDTKGSARKLTSLETTFNGKTISLAADKLGELTVTSEIKKEETVTASSSGYIYKRGAITSNLINYARSVGVPSKVIVTSAKVLNGKLDLSRNIRKGDVLELLYEELKDSRGRIIDPGRLHYVGIKRGAVKVAEAYRYSSNDTEASAEYFDANGSAFKKSITRNLLKGPSKLSSPFGWRMHPVTHRRSMHEGQDWAAQRGTPIMAAGDGVIEKVGRYGGYGNYIRIRHDSVWKTAYGHMSGYAKGMYNGARVNMGQVIGYVGSTGRSTGNHLHFEVIKYNRAINPMTATLPAGKQLTGGQLARFRGQMNKINSIMNSKR